MVQGKVKWYNSLKGYGFISRDDGGSDVFVHYSTLKDNGYNSLAEGEAVEVEIVESDKGPKASNLKKL